MDNLSSDSPKIKLPFIIWKLTGDEPFEAILSDDSRRVLIETDRQIEFSDENQVMNSLKLFKR